MQFTLQHGDGQRLDTATNADIIILWVSRTSKRPTSIYLGERGYKVSNIPLVAHQTLPDDVFKSEAIKVGLVIDPNRLSDVRKGRINILNETKYSKNLDEIISKAKPPIFWKEKDSVKMQVNSWNIDELREKIYEINDLESLIKNNSKNSLNIVSDFIISY